MLDKDQVTSEVERSIIRGAIYTLPKHWKIIFAVCVVVGTYLIGNIPI